MGFPIKVYRVVDRSMEPTLTPGDYIVINKLYRNVRHGDIVVMRHPYKSIDIVKRVDRIEGSRVYIVGDNAEMSEDSRDFGPMECSSVVGKMLFKA